MVYVIKNKQHSLTPQQESLIKKRFSDTIKFIDVPVSGLTVPQIEGMSEDLLDKKVIFLSPIPYFMKIMFTKNKYRTFVLHNDTRVKKELPNGKVIMTVPQDGWEIL